MSEIQLRQPAGFALLSELERAGAVTPTGLILSKVDLPYEQYEALCAVLGAVERTSAWLVGDALIYGERAHSETYNQAAERIGLSPQTLANRASVCSRIPRSRRRASLSFSTHAEVAYLEPQEQEEWLNRAEQEQWTRTQLRQAIHGPVQDPGQEILPPAVNGDHSPERLLEILRGIFDPDRMVLWLANAIAEGWSIETCIQRAVYIRDGAFA